MTTADKIAAFHQLHRSGCFVMPNPWDMGSARFLASLGFSALATTSAGLSFALGRPETPTSVDRSTTLQNVQEIAAASDLPVNADFQAGYGATPDDVAASVSLCVETGVAGLSIEDATGDEIRPLFDLPLALERLEAARSAIDASGTKVLLTGRAECFLVGHQNPLKESIKRLVAYAEAGADCVYAPGLKTPEQIAQVLRAVDPTPLNVLITDSTWMNVPALEELGVRRISVGSAMARAAWKAFIGAAKEIAASGTFHQVSNAEPFATLDAVFDPYQGNRNAQAE